MAYTTNPHLPKVRRDAVQLVKYRGWSIRKVAKHTGYNPSTISRWCKHPYANGWAIIPTKSSRPKRSPRALDKDIVSKIVAMRMRNRRCGQVVYHQLKKDGIDVSLSSVQRTLDRCHLLKKRSPWKRPHDNTERPEVTAAGALIQLDTIHIMLPDGPMQKQHLVSVSCGVRGLYSVQRNKLHSSFLWYRPIMAQNFQTHSPNICCVSISTTDTQEFESLMTMHTLNGSIGPYVKSV